MADITLPFSFTDESPASASNIMKNLYQPLAANSLDVMNGRLSDDNLDLTDTPGTISEQAIRRGALSRGGMVGLTSNLDYLAEVFPEDDTGDNAYMMVPGAGINFHLHRTGVVLLTWYINVGTDKNDNDQDCSLRLFVDGERRSGIVQHLPRCVEGSWTGIDDSKRHPELGDRIWSGHYMLTGLSVGWHSAGLGIYNEANLARVRVRHFGWVWFL